MTHTVDKIESVNQSHFKNTKSHNKIALSYLRDCDPVEKKIPTKFLRIGVDSEFVSKPDMPNEYITTQIAFDNQVCSVLEHPSLKMDVLPSWEGESVLADLLGATEVYCESDKDKRVEAALLVDVLMFFSFADIRSFFSERISRLIQVNCTQDARVRIDAGNGKIRSSVLRLPYYLNVDGVFTQVYIQITDFGKVAIGGLKKVADTLGAVMSDKGLMDEYKTNMLEPYSNPELQQLFVDYAAGDAKVLFDILEKLKERQSELFAVHGLQSPDKTFVTPGVLVSSLFESFLEKYIGEFKAYELFEVTNPATNKTKTWELSDLLHRSTVGFFASDSKKEYSSQVAALVQGGRAKNEKPMEYLIKSIVGDIDISGAYVAKLRTMVYPIGLPTVIKFHESSKKRITLQDFLKKYSESLKPNLWKVVVRGKLNHHQTLVPSKIIETFGVTEKYDEDDPKIDAEFRLYTKEIINGVVTHDVLQALRIACNTQELGSFMLLEVVTAVFYDARLECSTPEEWHEKTLRHCKEHGNEITVKTNSKGIETVKDNRSKYWLSVPIKDFLDPYANKRAEYKTLRKAFANGSQEYIKLSAKQESMKLIGNCFYGVEASPYFEIGNVVVANNITAGIRTFVWLTQVALQTYQSITDGGCYKVNSVLSWSNKRPGMNTVSLLRNPDLLTREVKNNLSFNPLGGSDWQISKSVNPVNPEKLDEGYKTTLDNGIETITAGEEEWNYFDDLALEHVRDFWKTPRYQIDLLDSMKFGHKDMYVSAKLHSQTNYQFVKADGTVKTKARGHQVKKQYTMSNGETTDAIILKFFQDLGNGLIPPYPKVFITAPLKVNEANERLKAKTPNVIQLNGLMAGDSIRKYSQFKPLSLSMFHWQEHKQYESWNRKNMSLHGRNGWGIEQYFCDESGNVDYERAIKTIQEKIDDDAMWISEVTQSPNFNHPLRED